MGDRVRQLDEEIARLTAELHWLKTTRNAAVPASCLTGRLLDIGDRVRQLDEEISHLTADLHRLKTTRNAAVPVGRLPVEVLVQIFAAHEPDGDDSQRCSQSWSTRRLYPLLHTSSHFRATAFICSSLWSGIRRPIDWDVDFLDWYLCHGGKAPLQISYPPTIIPPGRSLPTALLDVNVIGRIKELAGGYNYTYTPILKAIANHDTPVLERLQLDSGWASEPIPHCALLLRTNAQSLRHLCLDGEIWGSLDVIPRFVGLQTLWIKRMPRETSPYDLLTAICGQCPSLRTLLLHDLHPTTPSVGQHPKDILFPNLQALQLILSTIWLQLVLESIRIPPGCRVKIAVVAYNPESDATDVLLEGLRNILAISSLTYRSVHLELDPHCVALLTYEPVHEPFCEIDLDVTDYGVGEKPRVEISFNAHPRYRIDSDSAARNIMRALTESISSAGVESLSLCVTRAGAVFQDAEMLAACCRRFDAVRNLCLHGNSKQNISVDTIQTILGALVPPPDLSRSNGELVMPNLSSLKLRGFNSETEYQACVGDEVLARLIDGRKACGAPLEHLFVVLDTASTMSVDLVGGEEQGGAGAEAVEDTDGL